MKYELITALSTTIIALAALIVTVWQGIVMRKQNRMSVTPHFRINRQHLTIPKVTYLLKNCGIGPGIVVSVQLKVDGKISPENSDPLFISVLKSIDIDYLYCKIFCFDPKDVISAGEEIGLLALSYPENDSEKLASLRKGISRLGILIHYESVYGDKFVTEYLPMNFDAV